MFEDLVIEDMSNMDYCQLMVDELRRAIVRYQDGVTMGKAITGSAIGHVLMYLDWFIRGKLDRIHETYAGDSHVNLRNLATDKAIKVH